MTEEQQLIIFEAETGQAEVRLEGENIWLTQKQMSEVFEPPRKCAESVAYETATNLMAPTMAPSC